MTYIEKISRNFNAVYIEGGLNNLQSQVNSTLASVLTLLLKWQCDSWAVVVNTPIIHDISRGVIHNQAGPNQPQMTKSLRRAGPSKGPVLKLG